MCHVTGSGEGNDNSLQYSCLENPMGSTAWRATVHGVTKSWTRLKQLSLSLMLMLRLENETSDLKAWSSVRRAKKISN